MKMSEGVDELFNGMFLLKSKLKQPKFDSSVDYRTKKVIVQNLNMQH